MHSHGLYKIAKIGFFGEYIYLFEDINIQKNEKKSMFSGVGRHDGSSAVSDRL
jgi:hypothetical protein